MVKRPLQRDRAGGSSGMGSSAIAPARVSAQRWAGQRGARCLYTCRNGSGATGTHPAPLRMECSDRLEPPRAGQGGKIAGSDVKTAVMVLAASQRLMVAVIRALRLSPKDRAAEKHGAELASSPDLGTFSSHRD